MHCPGRFTLPVLCLLLAGTGAPGSACDTGAAEAAIAARARSGLEASYRAVRNDPECSDALRDRLRTALAGAMVEEANALTGQARRDLLAQAVRLHKAWWIRQALGEALMAVGDYAAAANELQLAINRLSEAPKEGRIDQAGFDRLLRLASAAVALADTAVPVPVERSSGIEGGILVDRLPTRDLEVVEVDLPVTFVFGTAELDERGRLFAEQVANALLAQGPDRITLAGHTDPVGTETYNLDLSRRRAEAMRDFLRLKGFGGEITILAFGEARPPDPVPGVAPGSEAFMRLSRRVELIR